MIRREASGRATHNAPRRDARPSPPPSKSLEDKIAELLDSVDEADEDEDDTAGAAEEAPRPGPERPASGRVAPGSPSPPVLPSPRTSPPAPPPRPRTGQAPVAARPRAARDGDAIDVAALAEVDKTKENRGAVGIAHDKSGKREGGISLTTNTASGTIGGDTPPPIFDRAQIAAGQRGALASERVYPTGPTGPTSPTGEVRTTGTGPTVAIRGTPSPGSLTDKAPPRPTAAGSEPPRLAVPVGEFDHGQTILEQDKLRVAYTQATIKRDAASALLGLAEPAPPATRPSSLEIAASVERARGDGMFNDASGLATGVFERGDPTVVARADATAVPAPAAGHVPAGTLRPAAALPRRPGIAGDIRYVATAVLGVRAATLELEELAAGQATGQKARRHHLVTLGRTAVSGDGIEHPAVGPAREQLAAVEEGRSQHAGHVAAADTELARVRRDREAKAKQYVADLAALDAELVSCARKLEPLEKEAAQVKRRAADLHEGLRRIDAKIAHAEASLSALRSGKPGKHDPAQVQAEIATLRADRKAIQRDEPAIAAQLDAVSPRIAAVEAARNEAQRKRAELERAEQDDQRRVEELLTAIGAKRKVVDRAAAAAEALRDKILFQLGEALYVDRPADLTPQLAPIDEIDVELGVADRRMMELREIASSVDKLKIVRGLLFILVILGAIGAVAYFVADAFGLLA
ncbi:MAG TPA: hypothetical protein VFT22_33365 [Kofleriaceae bacterium]|nr:hypothetical protein [Kofleriaceae bacterium]